MNNDLISREELMEEIKQQYCLTGAVVRLMQIMQAIPAVDAVEVVRCKDCDYWSQGICNLFSEEPDCRYSGHYVHTDPEAFCSYGEKAGARYETN